MIGIGVIGYGYWGPNLVRNFAGLETARLKYCVDSNAERHAALIDGRPPGCRRQVPAMTRPRGNVRRRRSLVDGSDYTRKPSVRSIMIGA